MQGELSILNVRAGDIRITFDNKSPEELAKVKATIVDLLRRGCTIAVQMEDGTFEPVDAFDPERNEYIILESVKSEEAGRIVLVVQQVVVTHERHLIIRLVPGTGAILMLG